MKKTNGIMTVYFSLSFLMILSLLFSLIETARYHGIQSHIQCVTDMAVTSVFAEYQKELLTEYDLFYIDSAYGRENASMDQVKARLQEYISYNMNLSKGSFIKEGVNVFSSTLESCELSKVVYATDQMGKSFYHQAVSMMKNELGVSMAKKMISDLKDGKSIQEKEKIISEEQTKSDNAMKELERIKEEEKQKEESEKSSNKDKNLSGEMQENSKNEKENPVETIKKIKKMGLLHLVIKDSGKISEKTLENPQMLITKRTLQKGTGNVKDLTIPENIQTILFDEYAMKKFSYWGNNEKKDILDYEVEYLLCGKTSDRDNLKNIAKKILAMREAANFVYLLSDTVKREEAEILATTIAGAGGPGMILAVTSAVLLAWAYAESILDVRHIFSGGKIPMIKTAADWRLSLEGIPELLKNLDKKVEENERGFSYTDYLRFFLMTGNKSKKTYRSMDLIERNIQQICHQSNIKLDQCIYSMEASFYWNADQMFFSYLGNNPNNYIFHSSEEFYYLE